MMSLGRYGAALNASYELDGGEVQTEAYLDPLGIPTGPGGVLRHADGRPVREGDRWSPDEALDLYAGTKEEFVSDVLDLCTRKPNQYQLDAMFCLAWNIGIDAFTKSTVLRMHNEGRFHDASVAFGMWRYGTIKKDPSRVGPDGDPLLYDWLKALAGVYRRHCEEACLYLGYDGKAATHPSKITLDVQKTEFDARRSQWVDVVGYATPIVDILEEASKTPLPPLENKVNIEVKREWNLPKDWDDMSPNEQTAWLNMAESKFQKASTKAEPARTTDLRGLEAKEIVKNKDIKRVVKFEESSGAKNFAKKTISKDNGDKAKGGTLGGLGVLGGLGAIESTMKTTEGVVNAAEGGSKLTERVIDYTPAIFVIVVILAGIWIYSRVREGYFDEKLRQSRENTEELKI